MTDAATHPSSPVGRGRWPQAGRGLVLLGLLTLAAPAATAQLLPAFGTDRAGTVGFQFLKIPSDPRAIGLGSVGVTTADDASALFWNPALATVATGPQIGAAHASYFEGTLFTTNYLAATAPFGSATVGVHVQSLDSGEMPVTDEFHPEGTGERFRFAGLAAGATFAQRLTDLFAYGVTAKVVRESTAGLAATTGALDVGIQYRIGTTGARMGVAIRNFGLDAAPSGTLDRPDPSAPGGVVTEADFASSPLPTTFLLGLSYDALRASADHALTVSAQLYRPNDNAESLGLAAEYTFRNLLVLRGGYRLGADEMVAAVGGGLRVPALGARARLDYGFTRFERLGNLHALGFHVGF